jgi:hypothetical protein
MRVLVTGSRDWAEPTVVERELDLAYFPLLSKGNGGSGPVEREFVVVHGACPTGADRHAAEWVRMLDEGDPALPVIPEPHPADWSRGRGAGPERNLAMVRLGADLCLAFIARCTSPRCRLDGIHGSHGATGTVDLAVDHGIPVRMHRSWP